MTGEGREGEDVHSGGFLQPSSFTSHEVDPNHSHQSLHHLHSNHLLLPSSTPPSSTSSSSTSSTSSSLSSSSSSFPVAVSSFSSSTASPAGASPRPLRSLDLNSVRLSASSPSSSSSSSSAAAHPSASSSSSSFSRSPSSDGVGGGVGAVMIVDVWRENLRAEVDRIVAMVDDFPFIAMDTEFPGVVARPVGVFKSSGEYHYNTLKLNVDLLKIIQLGLSFADEKGHLHPGTSTWQFNFHFSLSQDLHAIDSIELLQHSGLDFHAHATQGIDVAEFGELLMTSGLVLNPDIRWITFHSSYDFAYLLRILTCLPLPSTEVEFFDLLQLYFPTLYDVKYLLKSCENLQGGLQRVSDQLQVERVGLQHQAGSDSLLTLAVFFKIKELFFEDQIDSHKFAGVLFGLGHHISSQTTNNTTHTPAHTHSNSNSNSTNNNNTSTTTLSAAVPPLIIAGKEGGGVGGAEKRGLAPIALSTTPSVHSNHHVE